MSQAATATVTESAILASARWPRWLSATHEVDTDAPYFGAIIIDPFRPPNANDTGWDVGEYSTARLAISFHAIPGQRAIWVFFDPVVIAANLGTTITGAVTYDAASPETDSISYAAGGPPATADDWLTAAAAAAQAVFTTSAKGATALAIPEAFAIRYAAADLELDSLSVTNSALLAVHGEIANASARIWALPKVPAPTGITVPVSVQQAAIAWSVMRDLGEVQPHGKGELINVPSEDGIWIELYDVPAGPDTYTPVVAIAGCAVWPSVQP